MLLKQEANLSKLELIKNKSAEYEWRNSCVYLEEPRVYFLNTFDNICVSKSFFFRKIVSSK